MKAQIVNFDWRKNEVTFQFDIDFSEFFDKFKDKPINIDIKLWKPKRSGAANRYFWTLVDKLAKVQHTTKNEIYRQEIKEIGGVSEVLRCRDEAVNRFCKQWEAQGLGWQTEVIPIGDGYSDIIVYYGSSTFDTDQMSQLIDNTIFEAKQFGIDTDTPDAQAYWEYIEEEAKKHYGRKQVHTNTNCQAGS